MSFLSKEAAVAISSLSAAVYLTNPLEAQSLRADDKVKDQLFNIRSDEQDILTDAHVSYLARLPWEGGEADIAFISHGETGEWLGIVLQADCIQKVLRDRGDTNPTIIPGIYHPDTRIPLMDFTDDVAAEFPLRPIGHANSITVDGVQEDCDEVKLKDRLVSVARRIDGKLPEYAYNGAFQVTLVARAIGSAVWDVLR